MLRYTNHTNTCKRTKNNSKKLKAMLVNCDGLHWSKRKADFHARVNDLAPDLIFGCESKLSPDMPTYSIFPDNYNIIRKDRDSNGGGVFIATKENIISVENPEYDSDCEITWCTIEFARSGKLRLGSFYRTPNGGTEPLEKLQDSVNKVLSKSGTKHENILLCGDFNLPDIDWDALCTKPDSKRKALHNTALELLGELPLIQLVTVVTRQASQNCLDLIFTNNQNIVSNIQTHSGISDHDIVTCDINVSPKWKRKPIRKIYQYNKADVSSLKCSLQKETETFFANQPEQNSVDSNWTIFKDIVNSHMERFIPHKMSKSKQSYPWINQFITQQMRKRDRLYRKYKSADSSSRTKLWKAYKKQRNHVTSLLRDSQNSYMNNVVGPSLDTNPKQFWTYVKSLKGNPWAFPACS
ncbi:uncharacterized protein [Amphiura filiformis]|uniref:uncharacterized protein n=1 Tax=Amphiura filiformis TaxID=82378 RepID=UPI003B226557